MPEASKIVSFVKFSLDKRLHMTTAIKTET